MILVGHVTKDGAIAGPRTLEHLVDVVLHFEGDTAVGACAWCAASRTASARPTRSAVSSCTTTGSSVLPIRPGCSSISGPHPFPAPRSRSSLDGKRPLIGEVQALIAAPTTSSPRRAVSGIDSARAAMIAAVLDEARRICRSRSCDIYLSTVGGMRLTDPSSDLAVALAIASAYADLPLPTTAVAIGEVGLAGDLRRVSGMERRLAEAARLGFTTALVPHGVKTVPKGIYGRCGQDHQRGTRCYAEMLTEINARHHRAPAEPPRRRPWP